MKNQNLTDSAQKSLKPKIQSIEFESASREEAEQGMDRIIKIWNDLYVVKHVYLAVEKIGPDYYRGYFRERV